ncbi:DUF4135 domain-containing protein [Salmonella enterica subsp. enterica serovar Bareilly]|nr:DUF4135 domain-containing protein [Salmonella enterica subsp. enterica serovar Bareilly]ECB0725460.1 DUF4135 domain-containing protein [Salmonella enterica subsp. enterica serovar Noya]
MCTTIHKVTCDLRSIPFIKEELVLWILYDLNKFQRLDQTVGSLVIDLIKEFKNVEMCFVNDYQFLRSKKFITSDNVVSKAGIASADKHDNSHVIKIQIENSPLIYYKPRPGCGANLLIDVSKILAKWNLSIGAADTLDFADYHWSINVPCENKLNISGARNYAYNGGVLYGLAYLLNSSDLHFENIVAFGELPVVIDCETISQPKFSSLAAEHFLKKKQNEHDDISSLFLNRDTYNNEMIDYGGLTCTEFFFEKDPYAGLHVKLQGDRKNLTKHVSRSAIYVNNEIIAPAYYFFEDFSRGLHDFFNIEQREYLEIIELIHDDYFFRVPLRATRVYAALISESLSHIYFPTYSKLSFSQYLVTEVNSSSPQFIHIAKKILEFEMKCIDSFNIPIFYSRANSKALFFGKKSIRDFFDHTPIQEIESRAMKLNANVADELIAKLKKRF